MDREHVIIILINILHHLKSRIIFTHINDTSQSNVIEKGVIYNKWKINE